VIDYYKILGIQDNADDDTIKKAYRVNAKKYHPDRNKEEGSEEKFKQIAEAYEVLSNPEKKRKYDITKGMGGNGGFDDIFNRFNQKWQNQQDPFASHYNPFGQTHQSNVKGSSLNITLQITLDDILKGVDKRIKLKRNKKCSSCDGTGADGGTSFQTCGNCNGSGFFTVNQNRGYVQINSVQECGSCKGTGKVVLENCITCFGGGVKSIEDVVDIKIPAGASDGMQFVVEGKGNDPRGPGKAGDLFIKIREIQDPEFIRRGIDLITSKEISFIDAILGTNVDVDMPTGESVKAVVDPGTVSGTVLKFSNKGVPNIGYGNKGDFLVELHIKVPKDLNEEEKEFCESLKNLDIFK